MTALATDRNTFRKYVERVVGDGMLVAANTTIYNGAMVASDASGHLVPASDTSGLTVLGRARQKMVNATGSAAVVSPHGSVEAGVFKYTTTGGSAIVAADIGKSCFVLDDNNVVKTGGTSNAVVAGIVDSIDEADGGIWVKINC